MISFHFEEVFIVDPFLTLFFVYFLLSDKPNSLEIAHSNSASLFKILILDQRCQLKKEKSLDQFYEISTVRL